MEDKESEQYTVNFGPGEQVKELIIRHGAAATPLPPPLQVKIVGTIDAPRKFVDCRGFLKDRNVSYVAVDRNKAEIFFFRIDREASTWGL